MLLCDASAGVKDSRMVAATKELADFYKRSGAVVPQEVHSDMAGVCDVTCSRSTGYLRERDIELATNHLDDGVRGDVELGSGGDRIECVQRSAR